MDLKAKTASLSVLSNSVLIILKLITGIISGSVSIISEAIHSAIDLAAAIMAFYSVKVSGTPPDKEHPYGHGKFENVSGVVEAVLIFAASIWIIFEAINKIVSPKPLEALPACICIMLISSVINIIVSRKLYKVAKSTDSVALEADALHLSADVFTSAGVGISLFIIWFTNFFWKINLFILDPIVAILVALFIVRESFLLLRTAFSPLVDATLSDEDINIVEHIISNLQPPSSDLQIRFHQLRTRRSGFKKFIDLHLEVPSRLTVKESHEICDKIEKEIENKIKNSEVVIHVEPLD